MGFSEWLEGLLSNLPFFVKLMFLIFNWFWKWLLNQCWNEYWFAAIWEKMNWNEHKNKKDNETETYQSQSGISWNLTSLQELLRNRPLHKLGFQSCKGFFKKKKNPAAALTLITAAPSELKDKEKLKHCKIL